MHRVKYLAILGLLLFLLTACALIRTEATITTKGVEGESSVAVAPEPSQEGSGETAPAIQPTSQATDYCLDCHTNQQSLLANLVSQAGGQPVGEEVATKFLVDGETYPSSIHGLNGCIGCHGGVNDPDMKTAHEGVVHNPSRDPQALCGQCHPDIVQFAGTNLHFSMSGYTSSLKEKGVPASHPAVQEAINGQCSSCHATCGECHVSHPSVAGGGLVNGHIFNRTPPMEANCLACHGERLGAEYLGNGGSMPADLHYQQGNMVCTDCHDVGEVHGKPSDCDTCHPGPEKSQLLPPEHRFSGPQSPRCESCHPIVAAREDDVIMHKMHGSKLACQVCHSVAYPGWKDGEMVLDAESGTASYEFGPTAMQFLIGKNPMPSYDRPYQYVLVRHLPLSLDSFAALGQSVQVDPTKLQTWEYATPHNIQKKTPQTESCNTCHGDPKWFLTTDKVAPGELEGNKQLIVDQLPPLITSADQIPDW